MIELRQYTDTSAGRKSARERVKVEHALAGICNRKGPVARYKGVTHKSAVVNSAIKIGSLLCKHTCLYTLRVVPAFIR